MPYAADMTSGRLYSLVTKHWPRIAAGLVVVIGVVEFVVGGLTADSGLELYVLAWAGATGGFWFLFEKAERVLSQSSKERVITWVQEADLKSILGSIPGQFATLFDQVFGERHLSWKCFIRSSIASVAAAIVVFVLIVSQLARTLPDRAHALGAADLVPALLVAGVANLLSDYVSLLETRTVVRWVAEPQGSSAGISRFATTEIGLLIEQAAGYQRLLLGVTLDFTGTAAVAGLTMGFLLPELRQLGLDQNLVSTAAAVGFLSSFFTSVWLWLYAASVLLSRVLLKMNDGLGFLLGVTDVENQPFRSMGFVSVLIVSGLFLLGLPFVLL